MHRAKLKDGREVVVKVQYEEVRRLFATDFSQLQAACYFWTPQVRASYLSCHGLSSSPTPQTPSLPIFSLAGDE